MLTVVAVVITMIIVEVPCRGVFATHVNVFSGMESDNSSEHLIDSHLCLAYVDCRHCCCFFFLCFHSLVNLVLVCAVAVVVVV